MTVPQHSTASTGGQVDPEAESEIAAIADEYNFAGTHETVTIEVRENSDSDGDSVLDIYGYAPFRLSKSIYEDDEWINEEYGYATKFLEEIAPFLKKRLVVDTVGHDGNGYPLRAHQYVVWPDETIKHNHFEQGSDITKPANQDTSRLSSLTERLNSKKDFGASNDLEYLIRLADEALDEDEHFEDDFEQAKWAVAQWCQELQYVPDLREYETGQIVPKDSVPEDRETAELQEWEEKDQQ